MDCSTVPVKLYHSERSNAGSNRSSPENLKIVPSHHHNMPTNLSIVPSHHQLTSPPLLNSVTNRNSLNLAAAVAAVSHIPHHHPNLSLLNSLSMFNHHANPLDLMTMGHHHHQQQHLGIPPPSHHPPRTYNSPPPISTNDPTANDCKLVDYRGQKVAAFIITGDTMLCLPQAFELFLKHLVGGLHTVYTKLKRLDIVPLVCNVEQVRILRGLGAIQPGVNRCKLLSCKDFDTLYRDCTTAR